MISVDRIKKTFRVLIVFAFSATSLLAERFDPSTFWGNYISDQNNTSQDVYNEGESPLFKQWFTGPLLVPSPVTMPVKHPVFEPSVTVIDNYGIYNRHWKIRSLQNKIWTVQYFPYWQIGFSKRIGLDFFAPLNCNYSKRASYTHFTDITARLGYQILTDLKEQGSWTPNLRIIFQEIFPTGKYQKLNPSKYGTDLTGQGSFQSGIYLACEKGFNYHTSHAFNLYAAVGYYIPANFRVKRQNLYGGNHFTNGKVHPGNVLSVYFSGELELSKHIALAFDSNYQQNFRGRFSGNMGIGTPVDVFQMVTFSVAPELEVILSKRCGLLTGPWVTFSGQNTPAFVSYFVALLIIF